MVVTRFESSSIPRHRRVGGLFWAGLIYLCQRRAFGRVARYITWQRLRRKLQHLEQEHAVEKERTRIAQGMHDDLGVRLSEILLISNMAQRKGGPMPEVHDLIGRVSSSACDLVDNLDAIVWAVNPKNDTLDKFVIYLHEHVPRYLDASSIQSSFDIPDVLPACVLSSEVRHNLFLVVKEALHNVVKHSQATQVHIQIHVENDDSRLIERAAQKNWR